MIEMTMKQVLDCGQTIRQISQVKLPFNTAYKIATIIKALDNKNKEFIEQQNLLFSKYGERDNSGKLIVEKNGIVKIKDEYKNKFNQDSLDLLNSKVQLELEPIPIDEINEIKLTPVEIIPLFSFFK